MLHALLENPLGDSARLYKDAAELIALAKTVAKSVSAAMTRRASASWTIWLAKSRNSKPNMRAPRACGTDNARSCLDLDSIYEYGPGLDRPDEARLLQPWLAITTTSVQRITQNPVSPYSGSPDPQLNCLESQLANPSVKGSRANSGNVVTIVPPRTKDFRNGPHRSPGVLY